ncbi:MAG TPA: hypothetical protein VLB68_14605 [Pyrinomonadaceae bacterium]|nr:hypothetical protein [Pyrinomonadaceae bacterium]
MSTNSDIGIFITASLDSLLNYFIRLPYETLDDVLFFSFRCGASTEPNRELVVRVAL